MPGAADDIRIGLIGGSGLGDVLEREMDPDGIETHAIETPFGPPSAPIVTGRVGDAAMAILRRHGAGHRLGPSRVPYRANVFALKALGCTHVVASAATGSLRETILPGEIVVCDQVIDRTEGRPRTFFDRAAVHVEFADPFCPVVRSWLLAAGRSLAVRLHERGTYLCMEGPSFSTRAESHLHRQWGADVVGMTALPEARLAREAEMGYALIALPTDFDCWRERPSSEGGGASLLEQIIGNLNHAVEASVALIRAALGDLRMLRETPSPARDALALAIWSDRGAIEPEEIERLRVLWGRHF